MKKLTPQKSLEEAYQYECQRSKDWKDIAFAFELNYNLAIIERNEARIAMKIVVLGVFACMLGMIYIMWHYGVKV